MFSDFGDKILLAFLAVDSAVQALWRHVLVDLKGLPVWVYHDGAFQPDRGKVVHALKHWGPTAGLSAKETLRCPGAVACTNETIALIVAANEAKAVFENLLAECRHEMKQTALVFVHNILARSGFTAIKLLQVTRAIPYITFHPRRIAWSFVKHSTNKVYSVEELRELLLSAGEGEHIDIQLKKLNALPACETLVVYREIESWQVNVASFKNERGQSLFKGKRMSLPIFYLHNPLLPPPIVCLSKKPSVTVRKQRSDKRIANIAYLPSIHGYLVVNS